MKKVKNKKEEKILVDLSERENIKIITSTKKKKSVSDNEIKKFEQELEQRYNSFRDFTDFCIAQNVKRNQNITITDATFNEHMEVTLEQNILLKSMLACYISEKKEQEN